MNSVTVIACGVQDGLSCMSAISQTVCGMDVHLRDLGYFVAVADELHFTRAAERLHISQPALSRQIAKLESDLRVALVHRDRRTVRLTAAGQALLEDARSLLGQWGTTQRRISDAAAADHATLRIGMQTSVGRGILDAIRGHLTQRRPGWTVEVVHVAWDDPTAGLAAGKTDVAFCWLPLAQPDQFRYQVVATEQRVLAVSTTHVLADRQSISVEELGDVALVALPQESGPLRDFWLATAQRGANAPVGPTARTADETIEAVVGGLGAVILAAGNAEIYTRPGLTIIPITDLQPASLVVAWKAGDPREVIRDVLDAL